MNKMSLRVEDGLVGQGGIQYSPTFPWFICVLIVGFRFSNSLIASGACTFFLSTHSLSESGYPFHLIRYCFFRPLPKCQVSRIFSTSYSSSLSTRSGAGLE